MFVIYVHVRVHTTTHECGGGCTWGCTCVCTCTMYVYDINTKHTVFAYTMFHFCATDRDSIILEANHSKVKSKQTTLFCNIGKIYARRTEDTCFTICTSYLSNIGLVYTILH